MKNILIIGGSYFAGRVFLEELSGQSDYRTYVLNRGNRPLNIEGVEEIVCDRNNATGLKSAIPELKWHAVVDFCGYTPQDVRNLLLCIPQDSLGHYIFISTASVYAPTKDLPIKETARKVSGPQPELGPAADYGYQKWLSEQVLAVHCRQNQIPWSCLRPSIIYGKYNYAPRESYFFDMIHNGQTIVLPDIDLPLFQFVSVWDVAKIITGCMGNPDTFEKAFNLSAEELISYGRFLEVLEGIAGAEISIQRMSIREIDEKRIPLPFPLDDHLIYSGTSIQRTLNFEYTPFVEGMEKTYRRYSENS